jgi:TPR repeat protein
MHCKRSIFLITLITAVTFCGQFCLSAKAVETKPLHESQLESGAQLVKEKKYPEGYKAFKKMADGGCPYSQCVVALMNKNGVGVKKDSHLAFEFMQRSAHQGFADAQRWLAEMYLKGEGVAPDRKKALEWFEKAARNDVVEAEYKLGHLYRNSGLPELEEKGAAWISKAEKTGVNDIEKEASKIPPIPVTGYSGSSNSYTNGVTNVAQSWAGYSSLAKSLQNLQQP